MKIYKSYKFRNYDPILDQVNDAVHKSGDSFAEISRNSNCSSGTLTRYKKKKTRRPSATTVNAILHAIGYELTVVKKKK